MVSRFLPGVRAIVPPFAWALRMGALRAGLAMTLAWCVWYGLITWFAYAAGENFDVLKARMAEGQQWLGIGAAVLVAVGLLVWWLRRRRARA